MQQSIVYKAVLGDNCEDAPDFEESQQRAVNFVNVLANKKYEDIKDGNGMQVLRGIRMLEGNMNQDIVVRNVTKPFWKECIKLVDEYDTSGMVNRVAAVGTPGMG
jgi:hypothetical protein